MQNVLSTWNGSGHACAASLLIFALGCSQSPIVSKGTSESRTTAPSASNHQRSQLNDVISIGSTTVESPQISLTTNYSSAPVPSLRDAIAVNDDSNTLIAIWRSTNATAEERANALMKGLPKDTNPAKAEALLGNHGRLAHYFGILFTSAQNTNSLNPQGGSFDEWVLEYKTPHGPVSVVFSKKPGSSNDLWFDRAFPGSY